MIIKEKIIEILTEELSPKKLVVEDQSHLHIGHAGHRPGVETHFHVEIISSKFENLSQVKRHQMIYALLKDFMNNPIHALSLKTHTSEEFNNL